MEQINIIEQFVVDILDEVGVNEKDDSMHYWQFKKTLIDRVNARLFLEMVGAMDPEQAALVKKEIESEKPDPRGVMEKIGSQIPDFSLRVLNALNKIRIDLVSDLSVLKSPAMAGL
ncbi:MAG: hypothetical protein HZA95_03475 [Candidatus Vogelbacteria bacterium]|nr:hypothetical protein [Candidatus Vogelbacteria bacterium]